MRKVLLFFVMFILLSSCSSNYLVGKWSESETNEVLGGIVKYTWTFDKDGAFIHKTEHCFENNQLFIISEEFGEWFLDESWLEIKYSRCRVLGEKKDNPMNSTYKYSLKKISNNSIELLDTKGVIHQLTKED